MNKSNNNNPFEDSWNEMTKTFQSQFSAMLTMSENYFDYMNDSRKKMFQDIQDQCGIENVNTKNDTTDAKTNVKTPPKKEKVKEPDKASNADIIEGNWKQLMDDAKKQWSKLTNDNLAQIDGSREKLTSALQKNYSIAREEAEKQMKEWEKSRVKLSKTAQK